MPKSSGIPGDKSVRGRNAAPDLGLRAAWQRGALHEHPVVIVAVSLVFVSLLGLLLWRGGGRWQQYEVADFSAIDARPLTAFAPGVDNVRRVFRFSVRIRGQLDGEVDVEVHGQTAARLGGKVEWSWSEPHESYSSSIRINPVGPAKGKLTVYYRFHCL